MAESRVKLNMKQTLTHFWVVIFLIIIPIGSFFVQFFMRLKNNTIQPYKAYDWYLFWAIIPAILFYFIQRQRLLYKSYACKVTVDEFDEALLRYMDKLNLNKVNIRPGFFQARRHKDWSSSWGEMITIKHSPDGVMINSICDPDKQSSVISYGMNKGNISIFLEELNNVVNKISVQK